MFERLGAFERALPLLRAEACEADASRAATLLRRLARLALDEADAPAVACEALEALAELGELSAEERERWAQALAALGDWPASLRERRRALEALGRVAGPERWESLARELLAHGDDVEAALAACDAALALDGEARGSLRLRSELNRRLGRHREERADRERLAPLLADPAEAAAELAAAARIAREREGDDAAARELYAAALARDSTCADALLGAGELALEAESWEEAQRLLGLACSLLEGAEDAGRLARAVRGAARASAAQGRVAEALALLERALERDPDDVGALDTMADVALRADAIPAALRALERRLARPDLTPAARAERLTLRATALEREGRAADALSALAEAVALSPDDDALREAMVALLLRGPRPLDSVAELEAWAGERDPETGARIALRVARIEAAHGRRAEAFARLERLAAADRLAPEGCADLAACALDCAGPERALEIVDAGLARGADPDTRAALLWTRARALETLGRRSEATRAACDALADAPAHREAARLLAGNLGRAEDFPLAVERLERALEQSPGESPIEAELWEAIGRACAGPLEDLERALRAYRRALERNPLRTTAREALADATAFDPRTHAESARLHRELLAETPTRTASWQRLLAIAEHRRRPDVAGTCRCALAALEGGEADTEHPYLVRCDPPDSAQPVTRLLRAAAEAGALGTERAELPTLPTPLERALDREAGAAWRSSDAALARWLRRLPEGEEALTAELPRRARRRLRTALAEIDAAGLAATDPAAWRQSLLAGAAAEGLARGGVRLDHALRALLLSWPETAGFEMRGGASLAAAIELCPAAADLLRRLADASCHTLSEP